MYFFYSMKYRVFLVEILNLCNIYFVNESTQSDGDSNVHWFYEPKFEYGASKSLSFCYFWSCIYFNKFLEKEAINIDTILVFNYLPSFLQRPPIWYNELHIANSVLELRDCFSIRFACYFQLIIVTLIVLLMCAYLLPSIDKLTCNHSGHTQ